MLLRYIPNPKLEKHVRGLCSKEQGNQDREKSERCPQLLLDKVRPGSNKNRKGGGSPKKSSSPGQRAAGVGPEIDRVGLRLTSKDATCTYKGCPGI